MSDHRTYGSSTDCAGCRFWSEMIAHVDGGQVKAYCLNKASAHHLKFVSARQYCDEWNSGHLGAIDEPGQDPDAYVGEDDPAEEF